MAWKVIEVIEQTLFAQEKLNCWESLTVFHNETFAIDQINLYDCEKKRKLVLDIQKLV
jgi:hypothetical protein